MRVLPQSFPPKNTTDARQRFRQFFGDRRPVLLSVIPVPADGTVLDQVDAARGDGADGAFLLGDGIGHQKVLRTARLAVERHPDFFIGVSCPDLRPQDVFCRLPQGVDGVWSDESGIWPYDPAILAATTQARRESAWQGLFFAGANVSLTEKPPESSVHTPTCSLRHVDVLVLGTTESRVPGGPAAIERLRLVLGPHPLATVHRLTDGRIGYAPRYADCFLNIVSTSIRNK